MHPPSCITPIRLDRQVTRSQRHIPVSICVDRMPAFRKSDRRHVYRGCLTALGQRKATAECRGKLTEVRSQRGRWFHRLVKPSMDH